MEYGIFLSFGKYFFVLENLSVKNIHQNLAAVIIYLLLAEP
jgi:hypothetical protein